MKNLEQKVARKIADFDYYMEHLDNILFLFNEESKALCDGLFSLKQKK